MSMKSSPASNNTPKLRQRQVSMAFDAEEPEKPFENFEDFCNHNNHRAEAAAIPGFVPCLTCHGTTVIMGKPTDPVYGHRRKAETCPDCNGTGDGKLEEVKKAYDTTMSEYNEALSKHNYYKDLWEDLAKTLTPEQREALFKFGVPTDKDIEEINNKSS